MMGEENSKTEELRRRLLEEVYAMSFSGIPAAFAGESEIKNASPEKLREIAKQHGFVL